MDIKDIRTREEMSRLFDGYSLERKQDLDQRIARRPLVKSYMIEVLDGTSCGTSDQLQGIFARQGAELTPLDTSLYKVRDEGETLGFLEVLGPRIVVLYSIMDAEPLAKRIHAIISNAAELDHVWLSGCTFGVLWQVVTRLRQQSRYVRIAFTHDSIFEVDAQVDEQSDDNVPSENDEETPEDQETVREHRAARFYLVDRIRIVQDKLRTLQETYLPLYAISQLRFPSATGSGGHDFYENGKVTNRSDSFRDHRNHIIYVKRIYEEMLGRTENQAWFGPKVTLRLPSGQVMGAPFVVRFREPLSQPVFDHWIESTFSRQRNRFRLWGHPIRLGTAKVHVYGLDRHLWQPLFLEFTLDGCVAILPQGTCGNTIHRLMTNIQRYLDPSATAYLGDEPYEAVVRNSSEGVQYVNAD